MRFHIISVAVAVLVLVQTAALAQSVPSPGSETRAAEQAMARGDAAAAEAAYGRILAARPTDVAALVGRGNARAVQKNFAGARADFEAALASQPGNRGAMLGLGYTLAWSGRHAEAIAQFDRVLAATPGDIDAQRGAAYAELWRGDAAASMARFERALAQAPNDEDARRGLAEARRAREAAGPRFEALLWAGRTTFPVGPSESGLRLAEFAIWPSANTRLFVRYDDGLSRDNAAVVQSGGSAPLTSVGGYRRWGERYGTSLELGRRSNPDGVDQQILRAEQVFYLDGNREIKFGGWYGPRSDDRNEWLLYGGGAMTVAERWRVEPTLFYSRDGQPGAHEWRALLGATHTLASGWELGGAAAFGRAQTAGADAGKREVLLRASVPLSEGWRLFGLARRETTEGAGGTSVLAVGASLSWR